VRGKAGTPAPARWNPDAANTPASREIALVYNPVNDGTNAEFAAFVPQSGSSSATHQVAKALQNNN
jgi:hypothetical protein